MILTQQLAEDFNAPAPEPATVPGEDPPTPTPTPVDFGGLTLARDGMAIWSPPDKDPCVVWLRAANFERQAIYIELKPRYAVTGHWVPLSQLAAA